MAIALAHTLLFSLLMLGSFVDILLSVSGTATLPGTALAVPGYMVLLAFLYAGVDTGLGLLLGRPLVRTTNRLQTLEANFRFGLARSRENAEAIALMQDEPVEPERAAGQFAELELGWMRTHHVRSRDDLEQTLHRYVTLHDYPLPQQALNTQTPAQALQCWCRSHPELLHRRPSNRPGRDMCVSPMQFEKNGVPANPGRPVRSSAMGYGIQRRGQCTACGCTTGNA